MQKDELLPKKEHESEFFRYNYLQINKLRTKKYKNQDFSIKKLLPHE